MGAKLDIDIKGGKYDTFPQKSFAYFPVLAETSRWKIIKILEKLKKSCLTLSWL